MTNFMDYKVFKIIYNDNVLIQAITKDLKFQNNSKVIINFLCIDWSNDGLTNKVHSKIMEIFDSNIEYKLTFEGLEN